ncbi:MAG: Prephenate dehydratase [Frankiales bacterium]|nr:Prephenate dehydratase [Frankiales bacterium]
MPGVPPGRLGYLGPAGTFSEAALRTLRAAERADLLPFVTVAAALEAVRQGEVEAALVPLENSVEGSVATTLDELATGDPLVVRREVLLPVQFSLLGRPGTSLAAVRTVATHPHAAAQCRRSLARLLPDADVVLTSSTAEAARAVAAGTFDAAVSAPLAAAHYRLDELLLELADNADAVTRFVLVGRPGPPPAATGADRTTLVVRPADEGPGALLALLTEFAARGINLTRIESRPLGGALGRYVFSLDAEGHVDDARLGEALSALRRTAADVRYLGSYPRADAARVQVAPGMSDADFRGAAAWLDRLRAGEV